MSDCEIRLPPEILEMIFEYMDDEEVVNCSAVSSLWYAAARRFLDRTYSMHLCRWPDRLPSNARDVCLAGNLSIKRFRKYKLKHLNTLKLWYDEPGLLPDRILNDVFSSCKELSSLDILNVSSIEKSQIENILEHCTPGLRLRITLEDSDSSSYSALSLLEEYQELFEEIVVEYRNSGSVIGWHPIYSSKSKFRVRPSAKSVVLTSPGLSLLEFPKYCNIKSLQLEKCFSLNENVLLLLSQVNVEFLSIDSFSARGSTWTTCFETGFSNLKYFSSTNNQGITNEALKALCNKNLQCITLDFRKGSSEASVPHLYKLLNLVYLKIITNEIVTDALSVGMNDYWPSMRTLEVEECSLGNDESIQKINTLKSYLSSKPNITFIHKMNYTKFQENSALKMVSW